MAAVFFDIDGTIWDRQNVIPESTAEAFRMLHENGHLTFLCSGRTRVMIFDTGLLALGFDGILAGCGTYIEFQGKEIFSREIDSQMLRQTVHILQKYQLPVLIEGTHEMFMEDILVNNVYGAYIKASLKELVRPLAGNEENWHGSKFCAMIDGMEYAGAVEELKEDYNILNHGEKVLEIVPKEFSKATGIQKVCDLLGIDPADTYAFGDSINDRDMLLYAAHGIAMGNGTPDAKAAADYITTDIHEDGIFNGLKHFGLI